MLLPSAAARCCQNAGELPAGGSTGVLAHGVIICCCYMLPGTLLLLLLQVASLIITAFVATLCWWCMMVRNIPSFLLKKQRACLKVTVECAHFEFTIWCSFALPH
jgi:hypothetical protein